MAVQCFTVTDEYGSPVQNARIDVIVDNAVFSNGFTNPLGNINAVVFPFHDNLVYVRFNSYTPVQYVYNGGGNGECVTISIHTCHSLKQESLEDGRFLVWQPVAYCIRDQTLPLAVCGDNRSGDNVVCDRFDPIVETDYYLLPVKHNDSIRWVMDLSEVDYDGDLVSNLRIGVAREGVLVTEDIGTILESEGQLFCEAIVPCILDCEYELIVYRVDVIDYIGLNIVPPSDPVACDGQIQAVVNLGTPPYEYSLDGANWQPSDTFAGLCAGEYTVYARDSDCSQGQKNAYMLQVDCGDFKGMTLQQVIDLGVTLGQLIAAGCTLCDFVPIADEVQATGNLVSNDWAIDSGTVEIRDGQLVLFEGDSTSEQTIGTVADKILNISFNYIGGDDEPVGNLGAIDVYDLDSMTLLYHHQFHGSDDTVQTVSFSFLVPHGTGIKIIVSGLGIQDLFPLYFNDLTITTVIDCA